MAQIEMLGPDIRIIIIIIVIALLFPLLAFFSRKNKTSPRKKPQRVQSREAAQRSKTLLQQNPDDPRALQALAQMYFEEKHWSKAFETYERLLAIAKKESNVFSIELAQNLGIAAMHLKRYTRAAEVLEMARSVRKDSFEINLNLGKAEYLRKNFGKAVSYLQYVLSMKPGHPSSTRLLGLALARSGRINESQSLLEKAHSSNPHDAVVQFHLAKVLSEAGQKSRALDLFSGLTKSLQFGPFSLLKLGMDQKDQGHYKGAIDFFKRGLSFVSIPQEIFLELNYHAAECHAHLAQINESKKHLSSIAQVNPSYKDVVDRIEIYNNKWFYIYLFGKEKEFSALAYKIISRITNSQNIDIESRRSVGSSDEAAEEFIASTQRRSGAREHILFRFIRHRRVVSDMVVRSIQETIKDIDYSTAYCLSPKGFSDHAIEFSQGRAIKLLDKTELMNILSKI